MHLPLRTVIESVLIGVISTLLILVVMLVPILNAAVFLWPVPLIVVGVRRGVWAGLLALGVSGLLMSLLLHWLLGVLFFILHVLVVLGLSIGFRKRLDFYELILLSAGSIVASVLIALQFYALIAGQPAFNVLWQGVRNLFLNGSVDFNRILTMYHQLGLFREFGDDVQLTEFFISRMQLMVPAAILIFSLIFGVLNLLVSRLVLKKFHYEVPYVPGFSEWALPRGMGLGFMILLLVSYLGMGAGIRNFEVVQLTIFSLVSFIFTIQGLAVLWYFLSAGRVPTPLKWILTIFVYVVVHMMLTFNMGLVMLGMIDQIFGLRIRHRIKFSKSS